VFCRAETVFAQTPPEESSTAEEQLAPSSSPTSGGRPNNRDLAVIHYERGRAHYASGRYRLAVFELEAAYSLDPTGTNLLLNLGTVHERLGHIDDAILAYERHLAAATDPDDRTRTQRILNRLRGARVELSDISRAHGRADGIFWLSTGFAVTSLTLGTAMFLTDPGGDRDVTVPIVFMAAGGGLGILSLVLYFAREAPPRRTLFVSAGGASNATVLGLAGTF
jgi:tetratricopeptide (TPR) repeat protein